MVERMISTLVRKLPTSVVERILSIEDYIADIAKASSGLIGKVAEIVANVEEVSKERQLGSLIEVCALSRRIDSNERGQLLEAYKKHDRIGYTRFRRDQDQKQIAALMVKNSALEVDKSALVNELNILTARNQELQTQLDDFQTTREMEKDHATNEASIQKEIADRETRKRARISDDAQTHDESCSSTTDEGCF